jgi:uncharacterized protein (DUF924 family)
VGSDPSRIEAIHAFWFGDLTTDEKTLDMGSIEVKRWFGENDENDREVRRRFEDDHQAAARGQCADWAATPRGALCLAILLDQFPRNMFRGTPKAFETDGMAQDVAVAAVDAGMDEQLTLLERMFLYMPMMHSESLPLQKKALRLYERLVTLAKERSPANTDFFVFAYGFERKHYVIVERFGRYPHRNAILGRESSQAEIDFMTAPGSSF